MCSIITLQVTGTGYHKSKASVVTPHVFPVNVLKGIFIELRLKGLFQMVPIHQPDWTSVPGSTKRKDLTFKNVFILECVFNGLSNANKLSSICNRQVNCIVLPSDLFKDVIAISSAEKETCFHLDCKLRQKHFKRHFIANWRL